MFLGSYLAQRNFYSLLNVYVHYGTWLLRVLILVSLSGDHQDGMLIFHYVPYGQYSSQCSAIESVVYFNIVQTLINVYEQQNHNWCTYIGRSLCSNSIIHFYVARYIDQKILF